MREGPSCAAGAEVGSRVWFSVLTGLGCSLMLARPCKGKGGAKGMFTGGEGAGSSAFSGGIETSGEGEGSWVAGPWVFRGTT